MKAPNESNLGELEGPVVVACPTCGTKEAFTVSMALRGVEYICDGCGAAIESVAKTTRSRVVKFRTQGAGVSNDFDVAVQPGGVWVFLDAAEESVLQVLDHDSDRAVAIIVGSMIEARLQRAILARVHRDKKIEERCLQASGPLGNFSTKIDLAFMLGIVSHTAHADLVLMKEIRNLFAHDLSVKDFRSQRMKDKADNFKLVETHVAEAKPSSDGTFAPATFGHLEIPVMRATWVEKRLKRARERYLMTAQIFTVRLIAADVQTHPLPYI
jgi:DNA-binding MltR family transcriptional regulator/predicted RNA-binding Zn-ribbon protein involved in translation (DUF1610 family)